MTDKTLNKIRWFIKNHRTVRRLNRKRISKELKFLSRKFTIEDMKDGVDTKTHYLRKRLHKNFKIVK